MKTDQELKLFLARMLPEKIVIFEPKPFFGIETLFCWNSGGNQRDEPVTDYEWLHICWLVEQGFDGSTYDEFEEILQPMDKNGHLVSSTWQQRAQAMDAMGLFDEKGKICPPHQHQERILKKENVTIHDSM